VHHFRPAFFLSNVLREFSQKYWGGGFKIEIKKKIKIQAVGQKNENKTRKWRGKFYLFPHTFLFSLKQKYHFSFNLHYQYIQW
jgi:plasmid rolling circle replication initiator protein Rep